MTRNYKISLPEPCTEDWNKMAPNERGRFCSNCSKTVVDFTVMSPIEIQKYFQENSNICGRIKKSQLNTITIQLPYSILYTQTDHRTIFLLALFVVMGTTLFSCSDKNGSKQTIDRIEVIEDSKTTTKIEPKKNQDSKNDTINNLASFSSPKAHNHSKCSILQKKNKETNVKSDFTEEDQVIYEDNAVYGGMGISVYPEFIGGIVPFQQYIKQNFKFLKKTRQLNGTLFATFVIEKDGKLDSINVSKDLGFGTKEEFIRILSNSKKWTPGEENGKKRNCKFQLSLTIKPEIIKKSFFRTKTIQKIDTIEIKRITKYESDKF